MAILMMTLFKKMYLELAVIAYAGLTMTARFTNHYQAVKQGVGTPKSLQKDMRLARKAYSNANV
jgi:hypothetical protein